MDALCLQKVPVVSAIAHLNNAVLAQQIQFAALFSNANNHLFYLVMSESYLENYLSMSSPSGGERKFVELLSLDLATYGRVEIDAISNLYCITGEGSKCIMIEAHTDEVGMQVSYITDDGFIYFRRAGFVDAQTLLGSIVVIHNHKGDVTGVVGKKPVHLSGDDLHKVVALEDMWIDIFVENKEIAQSLVSIGDFITLKPNTIIEGDRIVSKGLDDKTGCYIISEAFKRLSKENLECKLYACFCSQEEVGSRGSVIASNIVNPDYAICVDVGFATDFPGMYEPKYGKIMVGKGPVINNNCDNNPELIRLIQYIAEEKEIPYQLHTGLSATGGTDTAAIQLSGKGVKTALISIPCRYMHTPVEMCSFQDINNAITLVIETVRAINKEKK